MHCQCCIFNSISTVCLLYLTVLLPLHFHQYFFNTSENDTGCFVFCISGGMIIGKASEQNDIPKTTLNDEINNTWKTNKVGRATKLTEVEEKSFKFYVDYMASINHPLTISAIKVFAWSILKNSQCPNKFNSSVGPGDNWYLMFKKRHNLTNRKPDNKDRVCSRMENETVFNQHFDLLEKNKIRVNTGKETRKHI